MPGPEESKLELSEVGNDRFKTTSQERLRRLLEGGGGSEVGAFFSIAFPGYMMLSRPFRFLALIHTYTQLDRELDREGCGGWGTSGRQKREWRNPRLLLFLGGDTSM
jgi:hypothetical protein